MVREEQGRNERFMLTDELATVFCMARIALGNEEAEDGVL